MSMSVLGGARGERPRAIMAHLAQLPGEGWISTSDLGKALNISRNAVLTSLEGSLDHHLVERRRVSYRRSEWRITADGREMLAMRLQAVAKRGRRGAPRPTTQAARDAQAAERKMKKIFERKVKGPKPLTEAQVAYIERMEAAESEARRASMSRWKPLPHSTAAHAISALRAIGPGHPVDVHQLASWIAVDHVRDLEEALAPAVQADQVRRYPSPHDCRRSCYALVAKLPAAAAGVEASAS